jgi:CRP-like cAMP-binding protein
MRSDSRVAGRSVRNELLAALPQDELAALMPRLERVPLRRRQVLQERNLPLLHVHFIESGTAALLSREGERGTIEVGTLGATDLVGIPAILGTGRAPHRCVVQVPGEALRISVGDLAGAMAACSTLRAALLGYVQMALVQSTQLAVCNARHRLAARLARWLLSAHDQAEGDEIPLTHQAVSRAIGVRRAGITAAIGDMEEQGLLQRGRGRITIRDRSGLEDQACDCYRVIRAERRRWTCVAVG